MNSLSIQRLRFSDWKPSPIISLACDPFGSLIAIGRDDGSIELADVTNKFISVLQIAGFENSNLKELVWSNMKNFNGRLFGISLRGFIFEVDFNSKSYGKLLDSCGGASWCMAVSPRFPSIVLGCEDGARVFDYSDKLTFSKSYPTFGVRILSVAYHPSKSLLYFGCVDGTIRCLDELTGMNIFRITGNVSKSLNTYIFSLVVLSDSTIVSGDNRGHLQIWDGNTGTLIITFDQNTADIRCIAVNSLENKIFASGTDSRVICIKRINDGSSSRWIYNSSNRSHTHDVISLEVFSSDAGGEERLVSGGMDSKICCYSIENFESSRPSWILPIPASRLVSSNLDCSTMIINHRDHVDLWKIELASNKNNNLSANSKESTTPLQLYGSLKVKGLAHIKQTILSSDGSILAINSAIGVRLWTITFSNNSENLFIKLKSLLLEKVKCTYMTFTPSSRRLAVSTIANKIIIGDIISNTSNEESFSRVLELDHSYSVKKNPHIKDQFSKVLNDLELVINHMVFSRDGRWLCVISASSFAYIYDLDKAQLEWIPSRFTSPVSFASFSPNNLLTVLLSENIFLMFDLQSHSFSEWSDCNKDNFPLEIKSIPTPLEGITFNEFNPNQIIMYGQGIGVSVNLDANFSKDIQGSSESVAKINRKRNRTNTKGKNDASGTKSLKSFSVFNQYRSIVFMQFSSNSELVVVENPWVRILDYLPSTLSRKRYGT